MFLSIWLLTVTLVIRSWLPLSLLLPLCLPSTPSPVFNCRIAIDIYWVGKQCIDIIQFYDRPSLSLENNKCCLSYVYLWNIRNLQKEQKVLSEASRLSRSLRVMFCPCRSSKILVLFFKSMMVSIVPFSWYLTVTSSFSSWTSLSLGRTLLKTLFNYNTELTVVLKTMIPSSDRCTHMVIVISFVPAPTLDPTQSYSPPPSAIRFSKIFSDFCSRDLNHLFYI